MDRLAKIFNQKNTVDEQSNEKSSEHVSNKSKSPTVNASSDKPSVTSLLGTSPTTPIAPATTVHTTAPAYAAPGKSAVEHLAFEGRTSASHATTASSANAYTSTTSSSTSSTNTPSSGVIFNHQHQFMAAVVKGSVEYINHYLSEFKDLVDIDSIDPSTGKSALRTAIEAGDDKIAALLVKKGAQLKAITKTHETPLMLAAKAGLTETVGAMIEKGAKIDKSFKVNGGKTALHFAVHAGQTESVRALLAHGATMNLKDRLGHTAIFYACKEGKADVLEALVLHEKFDEDQLKTKHINALLLTACENTDDHGALSVIKSLFQFGGSANCIQEKTGNSMLHIAVERGHLQTATYLLQTAGAEPKATNFKGETAAFFVNARNAAMIQLLNAHGITNGKLH
jgi:ankyrin repeat protein